MILRLMVMLARLVLVSLLAFPLAACEAPAPRASSSSNPLRPAGQVPVVAAARVIEEQRPFAVPTTPATGVSVFFGPSRLIADDRASVPWRLARITDAGRTLVISWYPGCDRPSPGELRFEETATTVVVQALTVSEDPKACSRSATGGLRLARPLGDRSLLHAPTRGQLDLGPRYGSLRGHFERNIGGYGEAWFRGGREVPRPELTMASGPEHCRWQDALMLFTDTATGDLARGQWVRDPQGVLEHLPNAKRDFASPAVLPADARFTGYEQGIVRLWTAASDRGAYIYMVNAVNAADTERWTKGGALCA